MTNVTNMFTNNEDVSVLRNNGYGSANFNKATTPLMYDTGADTLNISKKKDNLFEKAKSSNVIHEL